LMYLVYLYTTLQCTCILHKVHCQIWVSHSVFWIFFYETWHICRWV
jgi:hypothetical protein